MLDITNHIRRASVSPNCHFKSDDPYHIASTMRVDKYGLHIVVINQITAEVEAVVRQKVFRTLEENGIPNTVVEVDPITTVHGTATYFNQNTSSFLEQGRAIAGFRRTFTFGLTAEAEGWFDDEDGKVNTTLRLI